MSKLQNHVYFLISCIFFTLLVQCSPVQRHARLVKKYPYLLEQDTIVKRDTIKLQVDKIVHDTLIKVDSFEVALRDTIIIEKERLKVKMYAVRDSIYIQGQCDTIYVEKIVEKKIPIRYYAKEPEKKEWVVWAKGIGLFILIFAGLSLLYKYIRLFYGDKS